ncbi:MAG: hypothetical protein GDA41_04970 [Rhodospirillales bacterium]|nr:hypothetical protein [Rhodospirillales bacterium]
MALASADSFIGSTIYVEFGTSDHTIRPGSCTGDTCTDASLTIDFNPVLGDASDNSNLQFNVNLSDIVMELDQNGRSGDTGLRALLTKNDMTLLYAPPGGSGGDRLNHLLLGAWMEKAGFLVGGEGGFAKIEVEGVEVPINGRFAAAGGTLTGGDLPDADATWNGLAVATYTNRNDLLVGDAALTFSMSDGTLDATFSNFVNIGEAWGPSPDYITFSGVSVAAGGTYNSSDVNGRISGAFYGTGHAETAGTFERANVVGALGRGNVVGAFGAKQPEPEPMTTQPSGGGTS